MEPPALHGGTEPQVAPRTRESEADLRRASGRPLSYRGRGSSEASAPRARRPDLRHSNVGATAARADQTNPRRPFQRGARLGGNGPPTAPEVGRRMKVNDRTGMSEAEVLQLRAEIAKLRVLLWEAEDSLRAIRSGEVDALVFPTAAGEQVFVLRSVDEPYRVLVEQLQEGAIIASARGEILYCNQQLGALLGLPLQRLIGSSLLQYVLPQDHEVAAGLLTNGRHAAQRAEVSLVDAEGDLRPVQLSAAPYDSEGAGAVCIVATDLSEQRRGESLVADERLARSILEHVAEAVV